VKATYTDLNHITWSNTVFAEPPGVPSHFGNFFGHLDDGAKPLPVTLVSGDSPTNLPRALLPSTPATTQSDGAGFLNAAP
jgi:hypothetical protein